MKRSRYYNRYSFLVIALLVLTLGLSCNTPVLSAAESRYFPETGKSVSGQFLAYWQSNGGLASFGYPISEAQNELSKTDGKPYLTQWFERARFELHPENSGNAFEVQLGLLGMELRGEATLADPDFVRTEPLLDPALPSGQQWYFKETLHNLRFRFLEYWQKNGGLARFGYPISELYREANPVSGKTLTVQWFERARFEFHPENQPPYDVLLGHLGSQLYKPARPVELVWKVGGNPLSLERPASLAVDDRPGIALTFYLSDSDNQRILKYDSTGKPVNQWGSTGSGPAEFKAPTDLALAPDGSIYVMDSGNQRVQKFDPTGRFMLQFGGPGKGEGQFGGRLSPSGTQLEDAPAGLAVDSQGNLYAGDTANYRVQKFDSSGHFLAAFSRFGRADGEFRGTLSLAVDRQDNLYVADNENGRIQKFDRNGKFLLKFGSLGKEQGQFSKALSLAIDQANNLYVADSRNYRIQKFDATGNFLLSWGGHDYNYKPDQAQPAGLFEFPISLGLDRQSNVYVLDGDSNSSEGKFRLQKFNSRGDFLNIVGSLGAKSGIGQPTHLALDRQDNIYIARGLDVEKYNSAGQLLLKWSIHPEQANEKQENSFFIAGMAVDSRGNIYLLDSGKAQVLKFDQQGTLLLSYAIPDTGLGEAKTKSGKSGNLSGLTVDSLDNLFVADGRSGRVQKFDPQGNFLLLFGNSAVPDGAFANLEGLAVDSTGYVYLLNNLPAKYDQSGKLLMQYSIPSIEKDQELYFNNLALDQAGNLYFYDAGRNLVLKFDRQGQLLNQWGSEGKEVGQIGEQIYYWPQVKLAVDSGGNIYLSDAGNIRILKFRQPSV
ncbi:MAG TPA: 6-bladed beta-propeller [Chloroflexia bacterium]|nr:6-bladed beta-propeller [Chloroflexia bacterium]